MTTLEKNRIRHEKHVLFLFINIEIAAAAVWIELQAYFIIDHWIYTLK